MPMPSRWSPICWPAAMLLLLLDAIIALGLRGFTPSKMRWLGAALALFVLMPLVSIHEPAPTKP